MERLRQRGDARWWAWPRTVAWRRGRLVWSILVKLVLKVILEGTAASFSFLQIHFVSRCPPNMILEASTVDSESCWDAHTPRQGGMAAAIDPRSVR
jgi:hypothetical protein